MRGKTFTLAWEPMTLRHESPMLFIEGCVRAASGNSHFSLREESSTIADGRLVSTDVMIMYFITAN
jgi:hypothetical protein